jgi:hypothetical protein
MAIHPRARGATAAFSGCKQKGCAEKTAGLLDHKKMPAQTKKSMSGLGIQGGKTLLVYQWYHLRWYGSQKLEGKNKDLPIL